MSADELAVWLVVGATPAVTIYAPLYTFTAPWWRSAVGRALFTLAWGMAFLIDISVAYQFLGDDYPGRDYVRIAVYLWIVCGVWMLLGALVAEKWLRRDPKAGE